MQFPRVLSQRLGALSEYCLLRQKGQVWVPKTKPSIRHLPPSATPPVKCACSPPVPPNHNKSAAWSLPLWRATTMTMVWKKRPPWVSMELVVQARSRRRMPRRMKMTTQWKWTNPTTRKKRRKAKTMIVMPKMSWTKKSSRPSPHQFAGLSLRDRDTGVPAFVSSIHPMGAVPWTASRWAGTKPRYAVHRYGSTLEVVKRFWPLVQSRG
mmetsp:Transcript_22648/g.53694  ORF Transcript_22648/g.53694 Transcript_22648/m.53694 type:complete len:209 (+) Transcript_22648:602-1228(+)